MSFRRSIVMAVLFALAVPWAGAAAIPAGSHATVRLNTSLSSATAHTGEVWSGTLTHDIVERGKVVAKAGAPVKSKVTYVNRSGRLHKPGALTLRLSSINGETVYSSAVSRKGKSHTKGNAEKISGGAGAGAVIGALAGGGKGAAIDDGAVLLPEPELPLLLAKKKLGFRQRAFSHLRLPDQNNFSGSQNKL
jgi:hypothetical protein